MGHRLHVEDLAVDGRDVAAWAGRTWTGATDGEWPVLGERYVAEHPRAGRVGEGQRLALLRRLSAGPATRAELLAAMRRAGYVGANDFENRLRDLRAGDTRAAGRARLPLEDDGEHWWLTEPFAAIDDPDRRALGFARAMVDRLDGPMAHRASVALQRLLPGVAGVAQKATASRYAASPADFERFHEAMESGQPVRVRYYSLNSGRTRTYDLVPAEYVTLGATVKAVCLEVTRDGATAGPERQFALDRVHSVEALPGWPALPPETRQLERSDLVLEVSDVLYQVLRDRDLFGIGGAHAVQNAEDDSWRVTGSFPVALAWDVMEQLCAWAGNAQVWQPYWMVNAVVRRLDAGLRVMQEGAPFALVKPEVGRVFASHGEAVAAAALPDRDGPRKLEPRGS